MRYDFGSDTTAGMAPEALAALAAANEGYAPSYGADAISARCADLIRERVQADAEVRFVFSGTAANAVAVSMLAQPFEAVLAHQAAHICTDESGAPGFFGQGVGLIGLPGASGKIDPVGLKAILSESEVGHRQPPGALSLTQATEYGAVYTSEELRKLIEPVKARGLKVHLDGARLANAVAAGFDLADIPRLGVDVLVLGAAKAGALSAEALVIFDKSLTRRIDNRLKQAGQTASKTRFLSAPILGLLESGAWSTPMPPRARWRTVCWRARAMSWPIRSTPTPSSCGCRRRIRSGSMRWAGPAIASTTARSGSSVPGRPARTPCRPSSKTWRSWADRPSQTD